jgi:hypothetical protein
MQERYVQNGSQSFGSKRSFCLPVEWGNFRPRFGGGLFLSLWIP